MRVSLGLDADEWRRALDAFPPDRADVYFTPEYHALHVANGDGEAWASLVEDGPRRLLVPGMRSAIGGGASDLQTPNGYAGPLASAEADTGFLREAWTAWREAARADGVVAAFFRLHPLIENERWLPEDADQRPDRRTVFVSLAAGLEAAWTRADSRHRNMVRKARRAGAEPVWSDEEADWRDFEDLYGEAMQRLAAEERTRFGPAYFARLRKTRAAALAVTRPGGVLAAGAIVLFGPRWAHYHLAARRAGSGNAVANVVLDAAVARAAELGLAGIHLGGGRSASEDDALLRFKKGLGGERRTFRVARVVADEPAFARLIAQWQQASGVAPAWLLGYRQPLRERPDLRG